jgi:iron complex transport system substrate-binding protein
MPSRLIHHQPRLVVFFLLALVLLVPLAACGASPNQHSSSGAYQPVTVQSCGQTLTFTKPPTRVISTWQMTTDILLDLGLGDRIVGVYAKPLYQPEPLFQAQYARLYDLGGNTVQQPSKELALSTHPDFVFSAYPSVDFSAGLATQDQFKAQGAQIYGMSGECSGDSTHVRVTSTYDDILNIGRIFGVQTRAQQVVNTMKQHVESVQKRVASLPPTKVIALQNILTPQAAAPVTVIGGGISTDMLRLAGGTNLFGTQNQTYPSITQEFFAVQKPEAYVVINYIGSSNPSAFSSYLFSTYPNNPASKQHRAIDIDGDQWYEGIFFPDTVEKLARFFHPEAFQ